MGSSVRFTEEIMTRFSWRKPLWCLFVGFVFGGILLPLFNPARATEGIWLGGALGFLYCAMTTLFHCWTCNKRTQGTCACHDQQSWFGRLCNNHPLCAIALTLLYTGMLFVFIRLVMVAFGFCACEIWDHIFSPLARLLR